MKVEKQVCTMQQGIKLEEFGINIKPLFCYCRVSTSVEDSYDDLLPTEWNLEGLPSLATTWQAPAFTGTELGAMIGNYSSLKIDLWQGLKDIWLARVGFKELVFSVETESSARAELLLYLLQNEILSVETCNKRLVE